MVTTMIRYFALPLLVLVVAACSDNATTDSEADEAAIRNLFARYDVAFANEDLDGWLALLTKDVYWAAPNQPALIGQDAVLGRFGSMFRNFNMTSSRPLGEVRIADGWGVVSATYEVSLELKAGGDPPYHEFGKVIYVVERGDDGHWRIAKAVWNTDHEGAF
jgi:ketosteroid isomerase-like protein